MSENKQYTCSICHEVFDSEEFMAVIDEDGIDHICNSCEDEMEGE